MESSQQTIGFLRSVILPKMASLIGKNLRGHDLDRMSNQFLSEIFDEVEFKFRSCDDRESRGRGAERRRSRSSMATNKESHEMKAMRDEKSRLNNKLDEFSNML